MEDSRMAFRYFVFLVFPTFVFATINIFLEGKFDGDASDLNVYIEGMDAKITTYIEKDTFHLNTNKFMNSLEKYYNQRPDDFYIRNPTPWGDVFKKYGWTQVERRLTPERGIITDISSETAVLVQQVVKNYSKKKAYFSVGVSRDLENLLWSTWTKEGRLSVTEDTGYTFIFDVVKENKVMNFTYFLPWGTNIDQAQPVRVGFTSPLEIVLDSDQIVIAELVSTKANIQLQIDYEAYLAGLMVVNFSKKHNGHHFYSADVGACMSYANITNLITAQEVINIDFYTGAKLTVYNYNNFDVLMEAHL